MGNDILKKALKDFSETKKIDVDVALICPIRRATDEEKKKINDYILQLESQGKKVFYPDRDNPFEEIDNNGLAICLYNARHMEAAKEVHIWFNPTSSGSKFDLGMYFAFVLSEQHKKIVMINDKDIKPTPHKSFDNVLISMQNLGKKDIKLTNLKEIFKIYDGLTNEYIENTTKQK